MKITTTSQFVTTSQAAAELGISTRRVQAMIAAGRLTAMRFGRAWLIRAADLDAVRDRKPGWVKGRPRKKSGEKS